MNLVPLAHRRLTLAYICASLRCPTRHRLRLCQVLTVNFIVCSRRLSFARQHGQAAGWGAAGGGLFLTRDHGDKRMGHSKCW